MQSIGSARFSWRSEKGKDLSGDLHDAVREASGDAREESEGKPEKEEDSPESTMVDPAPTNPASAAEPPADQAPAPAQPAPEAAPPPPAAPQTATPPTQAPPAQAGAPVPPASTAGIIDQMPAMLWVIDGDLRFTSCRGGALADLGLAPDGLAGMTLFEFFQTEDTHFAPIAATLRALRGETVNYELDWGSRVYRVRVGPNRNGSGQIIRAVAVVFDISDVRREEERLLNEGEFLRKIAENMPDAVVLVDGEGNFLYASPSCADELGYDMPSLAGINFLTLIEPEDLAIAQDAIVDVYRGDSYPFAVRVRRADRSLALMETMATALTTADGTRLLLVSMRDVSEEKRSGEYVHLNRRMAELRTRAQETAENLRQLLVTIEHADSLTPQESVLAEVLTSVEQLPPPPAPGA